MMSEIEEARAAGTLDDEKKQMRSANELNRLGLVALNGIVEEPELAVKLFSRAVQVDKNHYEAYVNLGVALVRKGDIHSAVTVFKMATELNKHDPVALANLGLALRLMGQNSAAIGATLNAVRIRPDYAQAASNAAIVLSEQQRHGEAIHLAHHAVTAVAFTVHNTNVPSSGSNRIDSFIKQENRVSPHHEDQIKGGEGREKEEEKKMKKKSQNEQAVQYNLGRVCLQANLIDQARHVFEQIQKDQSQSAGARAQALNSLAYIAVMSGDIPGFEAAYQQASRYQPNHVIFLQNYGAARLQYNDFSGALAVLSRALEKEPTNLQALLNFGVAATRLGDFETAHSSFARALRISPQNAGILYNFGLLMLKSGLKQAGSSQLNEADRSINLSISLLSQSVSQLQATTPTSQNGNRNSHDDSSISSWPNKLLHTARAAISAIRELEKRRTADSLATALKYTDTTHEDSLLLDNNHDPPPIPSREEDDDVEDVVRRNSIDLYFGSTESMDITGFESIFFGSSHSLAESRDNNRIPLDDSLSQSAHHHDQTQAEGSR